MNLYYTAIVSTVATLATSLSQSADTTQSYEFHSQRKIGDIDHAYVTLNASGDLLVRMSSGNGKESTERQQVTLSCPRDYEEKTLQLPTDADKPARAVRYYREAEAKISKGKLSLNPTLRSERRLVAVEMSGPKLTPFSPRGPLNVDELELLSAVGDTLLLDRLLPAKAVKIGDSWAVSNETLALLLGFEEVTQNSVQSTLKEVTPEVARFELEGRAEGKLYGATNQITLKAKCRFDRKTQRIDWFAMGLQQTREVSMVEAGLDWTFQVKARITPLDASEELSDRALADLPLKSNEELLRVEYVLGGGEIQLMHDRTWFLTGHYKDQDEFHRLDHGLDIGMCKVSPQPQLSAAKLPTTVEFQKIVQKALGANLGEILDVSEAQSAAQLRIVRVRVKGKDGNVPVRWFYYHVSDPEGRQVTLTFRVEEKNLDAFGHADDALVESVRFVEKVEKK